MHERNQDAAKGVSVMIIKKPFPIDTLSNAPKTQNEVRGKNNPQSESREDFQKILLDKQKQQEPLKFSKHAQQRLEARRIHLTSNQSERLDAGVKIAKEKGVCESLILCDNLAFVVSVKNYTVVTAMHGEELKNNVFTNIDGAVIV